MAGSPFVTAMIRGETILSSEDIVIPVHEGSRMMRRRYRCATGLPPAVPAYGPVFFFLFLYELVRLKRNGERSPLSLLSREEKVSVMNRSKHPGKHRFPALWFCLPKAPVFQEISFESSEAFAVFSL
jgi:hypothetical protein